SAKATNAVNTAAFVVWVSFMGTLPSGMWTLLSHGIGHDVQQEGRAQRCRVGTQAVVRPPIVWWTMRSPPDVRASRSRPHRRWKSQPRRSEEHTSELSSPRDL